MIIEKTFNENDDGYVGKAWEYALKILLERKNADRISPAGRTDFIYNHSYYEVKQNGGVARYSEYDGMFRGSSKIIYATHIENTVTNNGNGTITVTLDLENTEFFVLDRKKFIAYLESTNGLKVNESRNTVNIQTMYNYTKNAYHGKRGKNLEEWARKNSLKDDILDILFDKIYTDEDEA
jgi:hypothetical protein